MACNDTSQDRRSVTLSEQQDAHSVDIFKRSWEVYQTVVVQDSVHHKQLFGAIRDYLEGRPGDKLSILDLGCGDAGCLASIIAGTPSLRDRISSHTGIDASAPALALCRANMAAALGGGGGGVAGAAEIDLREGGMLEGLAAAAEKGERFDVVLASLSLHHLSEAEKGRAVEAVGRVLAPGGAFVICDIFLLPGWSRDEFMRQYHADVYEVNGGWQGQDKAGKDLLWAHISNYDFPVELSHYQAAAAVACAVPGGAFVSAEGRVLTEVFVYKVAAWEAPPGAAAEAAAAAS